VARDLPPIVPPPGPLLAWRAASPASPTGPMSDRPTSGRRTSAPVAAVERVVLTRRRISADVGDEVAEPGVERGVPARGPGRQVVAEPLDGPRTAVPEQTTKSPMIPMAQLAWLLLPPHPSRMPISSCELAASTG
jgi:hypothetical protein